MSFDGYTEGNALTAYPSLEGTIIHSDCGSQYTSEIYRFIFNEKVLFLSKFNRIGAFLPA